MLGVLGWILGAIEGLGLSFLWALVTFANLIIVAVGALIAVLLGLLPNMPDVPELPGGLGDALAYLSWFYPVQGVVTAFAVMVTLWLGFLAVRIGMRWVKAL